MTVRNLTAVNFNNTEFLDLAKKMGMTPEALLDKATPILASFISQLDIDLTSSIDPSVFEAVYVQTWNVLTGFINYSVANVGKAAA